MSRVDDQLETIKINLEMIGIYSEALNNNVKSSKMSKTSTMGSSINVSIVNNVNIKSQIEKIKKLIDAKKVSFESKSKLRTQILIQKQIKTSTQRNNEEIISKYTKQIQIHEQDLQEKEEYNLSIREKLKEYEIYIQRCANKIHQSMLKASSNQNESKENKETKDISTSTSGNVFSNALNTRNAFLVQKFCSINIYEFEAKNFTVAFLKRKLILAVKDIKEKNLALLNENRENLANSILKVILRDSSNSSINTKGKQGTNKLSNQKKAAGLIKNQDKQKKKSKITSNKQQSSKQVVQFDKNKALKSANAANCNENPQTSIVPAKKGFFFSKIFKKNRIPNNNPSYKFGVKRFFTKTKKATANTKTSNSIVNITSSKRMSYFASKDTKDLKDFSTAFTNNMISTNGNANKEDTLVNKIKLNNNSFSKSFSIQATKINSKLNSPICDINLEDNVDGIRTPNNIEDEESFPNNNNISSDFNGLDKDEITIIDESKEYHQNQDEIIDQKWDISCIQDI